MNYNLFSLKGKIMLMPVADSPLSVWLTGFWGFSPEEEGVLGFTNPLDRDRLFDLIDKRQLVCIYGAASPETDSKIVHHLLGVLEVERNKIDSWDKISDAARIRNVALGRQEKWRHAMPVRRAWRTRRCGRIAASIGLRIPLRNLV